MKTVSMYDVKRPSCNAERNFPMELTTGRTSYQYERAVATKKALHDIVEGKISETELEAALTDAFNLVDSKSNQQRKTEIGDMMKRILRYKNSEKRHLIPAVSETQQVHPKMAVKISPDYWVISEDPLDIEVNEETVDEKGKKKKVKKKVHCDMSIELFKFDMKKMGKKEYLYDDIGIYAMLCRAKERVPAGKMALVKAGYYYLQRSDDKYTGANPKFETDFFAEKGDTQFLLSDFYVGGDPFLSETDLHFHGIISDWIKGKEKDECSKEDCEHCKLRALCNYTEPPMVVKTEKAERHLDDVDLTATQEEVISYRRGIARVNAGAGAGKTMVVSIRVASMIAEGVDPKEIFLSTFTNNAAEEMRERIGDWLKDLGLSVETKDMTICTFNAFGNEVLQKDYAKLGFSEPPRVVDDIEQMKLISYLLNKYEIPGMNYRNFDMDMPAVKGALTMTKLVFGIIKSHQYGRMDGEKVYADLDTNSRFITREAVDQLLELYDEYDQCMRNENLITFADQEVLLKQLLLDDPYYLEQYGFRHIIVDEFQDSNDNQIGFLQSLTECRTFESLMVVGDDNQAIYGFRGTTPEYIINFDKYFAGKKVDDFNLAENHRSKEEIIDFANQIAALNRKRVIKSLVPTRMGGQPVSVLGFLDKEEEMNYIVNMVEEKLENGASPEDIAIICRNKKDLDKMAGMLAEKKIPAVLRYPEPLLENSRVQAAMAFIEFMEEPENTEAAVTFLNAKSGGAISTQTKEAIEEAIADLHEEVTQLKDTQEADKMQKLKDILTAINPNEDEIYQAFIDKLMFKPFHNLAEYIKDFKAFGKKEAYRRLNNYPGVTMITAHSSKGLEWKIVFNSISDYDTNDLHNRSDSADRIEETRRLLFVSCTRARDELYVTSIFDGAGSTAKGRKYNPFLKECYDLKKQPFDLVAIETRREMKKQADSAKKAEEKKAAAELEKKKQEAAKKELESAQVPA